MNVMIVEDNSSDRDLLRMTFEHYRCTVIEAQDGEEAFHLAARHRPDIIVSDALMPRMDGFQLLRALKVDPVLSDIPFIFCSATYTGRKEAELALSLGAEAFLTKPIEPDRLWEQTCAILKGCQALRKPRAVPPIEESDEQFLREYGRMVAAKLEEKVRELEEALARGKRGEDRLRTVNAELTREIAERMRAEDALKQQERELAAIFEQAPFMMLHLDGERRVRRANEIACSFTGSSIAGIIGRRSGEALHCIHSLDAEEGCGFGPQCEGCAIRRSLVNTFETGQRQQQMEQAFTTYGEEKEQNKVFLLSSNRVMAENQPMVLLSLQDITDYRRLEEQLRQSQKMESIGTLAGGIAHDFNNILTVLIGYGEMTLMGVCPEDPLRFNIEQMLAAAHRASHLTRDLLLFGRRQVSNKEVADLNDIVRNIQKFLVRVIGEDILCTTTLLDETIPVFVDSHQFEQVLVNLATNARDAMPKGGVFTIATERIGPDDTLTAAQGSGPPGSYAVLTVTDTGSGMNEETWRRIFEPFFTTKEVGKGTGLGMAVVYGIVKAHGGIIDISSEPGKGATFRICLPMLSSMADLEKPTPEAEKPVMGTETILFAEDDELLRTMTASILRNFGYEVVVALDGEDAVAKFLENRDRIKLLLLDRVMPKKTGMAVYDEIKAINPDIRVIFASGYASEIITGKGVGSNTQFICKPFAPAHLLKLVRSALDTGAD